MNNGTIHQSSSKESVVMKRAFRTGPNAPLLGLTIVLLSVSVAFAAPPQPVGIVVHEDIDSGPDPFNAYGPAVIAGEVCSSGLVDDVYVIFGPSQGNYTIMNVRKQFDCGGGGTFYINMR